MKKHHLAWLFLVIALVLCFIWGNSLLPGEQSGDVSGGLLVWLQTHFPIFTLLTEYILRKLGHFSEFTLLGFFLTWLAVWWGEQGYHRFTMPLLLSMIAANVDEAIQTITPNRGPSVIDVWIDTGGAVTGIVIALLAYAILNAIRNRKQQ